MSNIDFLARNFIKTLVDVQSKKSAPYDTQAEVRRVDGDTAWVHIPGGVDETPVQLTSNAKKGDIVQVRVSGGRAWLYGNVTAPPTDDTKAISAEKKAMVADEHATDAVSSAMLAKDAADSAQASAATAKAVTDEIEGYAQTVSKTVTQVLEDGETAGIAAQQASEAATSALKGLSTVEDVVDTLNWIATHCEYEKTTDTTIVTGKAYYTVTATQVSSPTDADIATYYELVSGEYVKTTDTSVVSGKDYYTVVGEPVTNPVVADIGTYYELDVTEAVSNYINTHVAVTDEGLWLIPDDTQGSNRVLIAVGGQGHTYEQAGTYIIDGNDNISAQFLEDGVTIYGGASGRLIAHLGYGPGADSGGSTSNAPYYTLGVRDETSPIYSGVGNYSVAEGNGNIASEYCSHAEGRYNASVGFCSHSEGSGGLAEGAESHTEGIGCNTKGLASHAEGGNTTASGDYSHAEGYVTTASGYSSHAEGSATTASGISSHAEGSVTTASGNYSHAQNRGTDASKRSQTALGTFNEEDTSATTTHPSGDVSYGQYAVIVGNGASESARSNALTVDWDGRVDINNVQSVVSNDNAYIKIRHSSIDSDGTAPSATVYSNNLHSFDTDGTRIGYIENWQNTSNVIGMNIGAARKVNGSMVYNSITANVDANGNMGYALGSPNAFKKALSLADAFDINVVPSTARNINIGATANATGNFSVKRTGWKAIACCGWNLNNQASGGQNVSLCVPYGMFLNTQEEFYYEIRNNASSQAKITIQVYILYIKTTY